MKLRVQTTSFNISNFLKDLDDNLRNKIYSCVFNEIDEVTVYSNVDLNNDEITLIKNVVSLHKKTKNSKLRINRVLSEDLNPLTSDFTILGFEKVSPSYHRGRKIKSEYKCPTSDELIVTKTFNDILDDNGQISKLEVLFDFYNEDNIISLSKTEVVKRYNKYEVETEERKRRYRQFDYLRASVKNTDYEPYVAILIGYFQLEIDAYKNDGLPCLDKKMKEISTIDLSTVPESERSMVLQVQTILNSPIARNDGLGTTLVIKSIQYQISTITLEEL